MPPPSLSKSKYLEGLQCLKLLWHEYNAKQEIPERDEQTKTRFEQGHEVGNLAKQLYPGGIEVAWEDDIAKTVRNTLALLPSRKPLFEASFASGGTYARADILNPVPGGKWDIIEVKSTTEVKDVHLSDLALQRYCYEGAGVAVRRCRLMHINNEYVRQGPVDPGKLFVLQDVTEALQPASEGIRDRIAAMQAAIAQAKCPEVDIGPHCTDPYECPLIAKCRAKVTKHEDNVFTLYGLRKAKAWELYGRQVLRNSQLPADYPLTKRQSIQVACERTGKPHVAPKAVRAFLDSLAYPLYLLDFESFQTPIPLIDGTRPYQQIPFQFSLHRVDQLDSTPAHFGWICDLQEHPLERMLAELKPLIGPKGSVIAFHAVFERGRLQEAADACPRYRSWVTNVLSRTVDLLDPFRAFDVYYPAQHGSASMKQVLPSLTGTGYDNLEISDGTQAAAEYLRVMYGAATDKDRRAVLHNLETYCGQDTGGMLKILRVLRRDGAWTQCSRVTVGRQH